MEGRPIALSPDGHTVVVRKAFSLSLRNVITGGELVALEGDLTPLVKDGQRLRRFYPSRPWEWPISFSADGSRMASVRLVAVPESYQLNVWDVSTGSVVFGSDKTTLGMGALAMSPDGRTLASIAYYGAGQRFFIPRPRTVERRYRRKAGCV